MHVTRTAWHDWYVDDTAGESAVFVGDRVLVLAELATTLAALVGDGIALDALAHDLSEAFGVPEGDPVDATLARVTELVASGVLALDEPTP